MIDVEATTVDRPIRIAEVRDVTPPTSSCNSAFARFNSCPLNRFGRLDGLIANAGVPEAASFARKPLADFRAVFDINFFGTLYVVHAAWKILLSQKSGRVVLSTSAAGLHGNRGMAAYSASKAALIGLMRALALEGGNANVNINAIAPYATTAMTENYIDKSTAQRMKPESVAPIAAWLVSESCNVTGQTFITGANRLRRGYAVEGPLIAIGDDVGRAIHQASRVGTAQAFAHANEAFQVFLSQEPSL